MRLTVTMKPKNNVVILPLHYQYLLQGLLYRSLKDKSFASFLHEIGFRKGKRTYKLFTFSRLFGQHKIQLNTKTIVFYDEISWHVSTVLPELTQQLGEYFLLQKEVYLGDQSVKIQSIKMEECEVKSSEIEIEMLSPVTVYSTYETVDGTQKTQFFHPYDEVFPHLIEVNFRNKYEAYYGAPPQERLFIEPLHVTKKHKVVTTFKNYYITAWQGRYRLRSAPKNLTFLLQTGIGGRNSQGFGMFHIIREL
ncbi:CRISPR-associated Cas6 family protein [Anoxybacillus vitaminiphilus]|uniref:CRISPR-associated endoribonuclease n=1 Tax=Paranoxybacillus vitaminiphilus TaxID=581036 RepID=A0A327YLI5_9BACL|nr:CRISPR-associated endoribonuclease Cas6 [Anoxybacillus vitaminiphilus]RAK19109.1 CRISPR-associated Cas6 family protein [Anoxybacillus vitaminiphilus]